MCKSPAWNQLVFTLSEPFRGIRNLPEFWKFHFLQIIFILEIGLHKHKSFEKKLFYKGGKLFTFSEEIKHLK